MSRLTSADLQSLERCPLCGGAGRKPLFPITQSRVYQCTSCRLKYLDPCLSPSSTKRLYETGDSLAALHSFHVGYYDYGDLERKSKTLKDFTQGLRLMEVHLKKDGPAPSLLDVGFGNGLFPALAEQRGWRVQGIDTSAKNVETARRKFGLKLQQGDLETYEGPLYDAISFWDVIEHLPDPHHTLKKAAQRLKPDGFILIGVPNDASLLGFVATWLYRLSGCRVKKGIETLYLLEHVAYYNLRTLTSLMEKNGFGRKNYFFTSTDLAKYNLPRWDKFLVQGLLWGGRLTCLENRLVALFQKRLTP